jgi:5-methylcytosine-specific restriction endonuclease McrA
MRPNKQLLDQALERLVLYHPSVKQMVRRERRIVRGLQIPGTSRRRVQRHNWFEWIFQRDGNQCVWCATPLRPGDETTSFEHVIPRVHGGPDRVSNFMGACKDCNNDRKDTSAAVWAMSCAVRGQQVNWQALHQVLAELSQGESKVKEQAQVELGKLRTLWQTQASEQSNIEKVRGFSELQSA